MALSRRAFLSGAIGGAGAAVLSGCQAARIGSFYNPIPVSYLPPETSRPFPVPPRDVGEVNGPVETAQNIRQSPTSTSRYVAYQGGETAGTLLINRAQRKVYFVEGNGRAIEYPIAVGREGTGALASTYTVFNKAVNPSWTPTPSMRAKNPSLPVRVQGGVPSNPLGTRAIYLAVNGRDSLLRFHGTNDPASIGNAASSGCFRMHNHDVEDLYARVQKGALVRTYEGRSVTPGIGMP